MKTRVLLNWPCKTYVHGVLVFQRDNSLCSYSSCQEECAEKRIVHVQHGARVVLLHF